MIRLTGGNYHNEGLLEVYCNREWGTVCGSNFTQAAAEVACRQLGYQMFMDYNHLITLSACSQTVSFSFHFFFCFLELVLLIKKSG